MLSNFYIEEHVKQALQEEIGFGDVTTESFMAEDKIFCANLTSRTEGIICGLEVFKTVFKILSDKVEVKLYFKDGDKIKKGDVIMKADLDKINAAGFDTVVPVVVTNPDEFKSIEFITGSGVKSSDVLAKIKK